MSIGVSVRTTKFAARNSGIGVRQESNPQSPTVYSFERYGTFVTVNILTSRKIRKEKLSYFCEYDSVIMETQEILKAIKKLPVNKQMLIIEKTLKTLRESDTREKMIDAANTLFDDYSKNKELTEFTVLDCESFYETR